MIECCANCGDLVDALDENTGWCYTCAGVTPAHTSWYIRWLFRNADEIERTMARESCNATKAKKIVAIENRPICICCKQPINRGNKSSDLFCSRTPECRRAQNTYRRARTVNNKSQEIAIIEALSSALILRLLSTHDAAA